MTLRPPSVPNRQPDPTRTSRVPRRAELLITSARTPCPAPAPRQFALTHELRRFDTALHQHRNPTLSEYARIPKAPGWTVGSVGTRIVSDVGQAVTGKGTGQHSHSTQGPRLAAAVNQARPSSPNSTTAFSCLNLYRHRDKRFSVCTVDTEQTERHLVRQTRCYKQVGGTETRLSKQAPVGPPFRALRKCLQVADTATKLRLPPFRSRRRLGRSLKMSAYMYRPAQTCRNYWWEQDPPLLA